MTSAPATLTRFRRCSRLACKADFEHVFAQPEKSTDPCFTVLARSNTLNFTRLGLAVSRKSARSAVVRNRIKRVIRESFRHHQETLRGIDVIVISRANAAQWDNATFFDSLHKHWMRLAKRCAKP